MSHYWLFPSLVRQSTLRERLIVSLDRASPREVSKLVDLFAHAVGMFKVGRTLFLNGGPDLVRDMRRRGAEVFLDLKFHDHQRAVVRAALEATRLGVRMFDLQARDSVESMERIRVEVSRLCHGEGLRRPYILAVALLARLDRAGKEADGEPSQVAHLARLAAQAALDGVLIAPQSTLAVRNVCGRRFTIVTPLPGASLHIMSQHAAELIRAGANYLVLGGSLWQAAEPLKAMRELIEGIEQRLRQPASVSAGFFSSRLP